MKTLQTIGFITIATLALAGFGIASSDGSTDDARFGSGFLIGLGATFLVIIVLLHTTRKRK